MSSPAAPSNRRLWLAYAASCLLAWALYVLAGSEFDRGLDPFWLAVYQATTTLWAPALLGVAVWPLTRRLYRRPLLSFALGHLVGALSFGLAWLVGEYLLNSLLFGPVHAGAVLQAVLLWRGIVGVAVYAAMAIAFNAVLQGRAARSAAVAAAQAEAALAKAELAAISGKLNPHFLFNTLNSLIALARTDAAQAEQALLRFASMLRYVLDTKRDPVHPHGRAVPGLPPEGAQRPWGGPAGAGVAASGHEPRVPLADEVAFLRDYLALEALRLGDRLRVDWQIDEAVLADELPPLTLQPLVENAVQHGVAPRKGGGCVTIRAARDRARQGLALSVADDGPGCEPASLDAPDANGRQGIGLAALRKRFSLDYGGRARLSIHTAPGAGFRVDLWIPQT